MKYKKSFCLLLFFFSISNQSIIAQCFGGNGRGDSSSTTGLIYFNGSGIAPILFTGGNGRGDNNSSAVLMYINSTTPLSISFAGGGGRGDSSSNSGLLYFDNQASGITFIGGSGRGDSSSGNSLQYFDHRASVISYTGGIGRGDSCSGTDLTCLHLPVLGLKLYIEGYYTGGGQMKAVLYNTYPSFYPPNAFDSITVELHSSSSPATIFASVNVLLLTDGTTIVKFPNLLINNSYYIAIRHRNSLETWSNYPLSCNCSLMSFDFSK